MMVAAQSCNRLGGLHFDLCFVVLWTAVDDGWQVVFVVTPLPSLECI